MKVSTIEPELLNYCCALDYNKQIECEDISDSNEVCKILAEKKVESVAGDPVKLRRRQVKSLFLGAVEKLGRDTSSFYEKEVPKVKIKKTDRFPNGEIILPGGAAIFRRDNSGVIYTHKKDHTTKDIVAMFHEFGHLPLIVNGANGDYYEYQEVLPIYMERFGFNAIDESNAKEMFERTNLGIAIAQAKDLMYYVEHDTDQNRAMKRINEINRRTCFSYIKSFEYVLQLLERYQEDHRAVDKAIDKVINGESSFKGIERTLDIDTKGCKKILSRF